MSGSISSYILKIKHKKDYSKFCLRMLWRYKHQLKCQMYQLITLYRNVVVLCAFEKETSAERYLKCLYDILV